MTLIKSLMLGSAATIVAVAGAQAADLPSKKAAPATYVKVCDAYGAGFFVIPGTDTCVKVGGYVRAEYQYTPGSTVTNVTGGILQRGREQSSTGFESRGRIDIDARTPTEMGPARTFVRLRLTNNSGVRRTTIADRAAYTMGDASTQGSTLESALVQWAGFSFGLGPENYAMMPSTQYGANPWAGFPNGMKQIAYTHNFGGGITATLALEDARDQNNAQQFLHQPKNAAIAVANVRLDQSWGFAAVHGAVGNNSVTRANFDGQANPGSYTRSAYAVGSTVSFRLPMIAAGDQVWLTANYVDGMTGMLLSTGGLSNVNTAANARLLGGLVRVDTNMVDTGFNDANNNNIFRNTTGWNVAGQFTHYWAPKWRSNFVAGYVELNPPNSATNNAWGRGRLQVYTGSIIYSPVRNLDIGLELQYANLNNNLQNPTTAVLDAGSPGLNESNWTTKLRVERSF